MVNRIVVGAHYGLRDWLVQRLSAVVMAVYAVILFIAALSGNAGTYEGWKGLFGQGWLRFATFLFVLSVLLHAWVGMRDIWMDYVKSTGLRLALQALTVLWLVGCGGWAVQVLWRL
jgi:succinate dehydrogenase / fumarate reductase membrane anchor subunit